MTEVTSPESHLESSTDNSLSKVPISNRSLPIMHTLDSCTSFLISTSSMKDDEIPENSKINQNIREDQNYGSKSIENYPRKENNDGVQEGIAENDTRKVNLYGISSHDSYIERSVDDKSALSRICTPSSTSSISNMSGKLNVSSLSNLSKTSNSDMNSRNSNGSNIGKLNEKCDGSSKGDSDSNIKYDIFKMSTHGSPTNSSPTSRSPTINNQNCLHDTFQHSNVTHLYQEGETSLENNINHERRHDSAPSLKEEDSMNEGPVMEGASSNRILSEYGNAIELKNNDNNKDIYDIYNKYDAPPKIQKLRTMARSVKEFDKLEQIGLGTYGRVYKAIDKSNNHIVALKKILNHKTEGFPVTAVREMYILRKCQCENVVRLLDVVMGKNSAYFVFEYMDYDLEALSRNPSISLTYAQIKGFLFQILKGLEVVHERGFMHRDLKGSNILMNRNGIVKLADFGFARAYEDFTDFTNHRMTLHFRPPEILLGSRLYGPPADMWSIGIILADLLLKSPLLPGKTEFDQLHKIYSLCGAPNPNTWAEVSTFESWNLMKPKKPYQRNLNQSLIGIPLDALNFIDQCLQLNPKDRLTCKQALQHSIFKEEPLPAPPDGLPRYDSCHWYTLQLEKKRTHEGSDVKCSKRVRLSS